MRSITLKLLLAFLGISLVSIVLLFLITRWTTDREFRNFLFNQNQNSILSALEDYYSQHGSWQGVDQALLIPGPLGVPRGVEEGRRFFTLVDSSKHVVLAGPGEQVGDLLSQSEIAGGLPIKVNGKTVGVMVIREPTVRVSPAETAFLNRLIQIYILSSVGVIALSLLLAFLLSRTLTRPIRELTEATRSVSAGQAIQEVPVRSRDELGELAASFNRMNAELAQATELRRQMTVDIAHELRTPVSIIIGHADAVHDGVVKPSLESFEIIRDEASRLGKLIEDLRTLSRADAGELPIERRPVPPARLLEDVRAVHNHRAEQEKISLKVQAASHLPEIDADPDRINQVLSNLVDNALRYTPEGGQILLSARLADGSVEIKVQDSGPGIPKDDLNRVFDRFYRSDPSRQRDEGGTGLGLAIARSIVEKHGGRIWAESKPGKGTTMVILLPLARE